MANCKLPVGSNFFTVDDIALGISSLKNNKSIGNCHISADVLKVFRCEKFCALLCVLFNAWVEQGLPSTWTSLHLTSLFKNKGDRTIPSNYRGLSVMNCFAKLYSTCITNRLNTLATERDLRASA